MCSSMIPASGSVARGCWLLSLFITTSRPKIPSSQCARLRRCARCLAGIKPYSLRQSKRGRPACSKRADAKGDGLGASRDFQFMPTV